MLRQYVPDRLKQLYLNRKRDTFFRERPSAVRIVPFREGHFFASMTNKIEAALLSVGNKYDWANHQMLASFVGPDSICFDIGANIGVYSVVMGHRATASGAVHAFEPVSHIRKKLEANVRLNGLTWVTVNSHALGAEDAVMDMYQVKEDQFRGGTSTFRHNENVTSMGADKFNVTPVQVKTLDGYARDKSLNRIDFMKIDVEGFEWPVIEGGQTAIETFRPTILMEYDPVRHAEYADRFRDFFDRVNYVAYEFVPFGQEMVFVPFPFDRCPLGRNIVCVNQGPK